MLRLLTTTLFALLALLACSRQPAAEEPAPKAAAPATPAKAKSASSYTVNIVPGAAKAGQPSTTVVEVRPGPGFKINLEFPARLKLLTTEGLKTGKRELSKDDAELTKAVLRFSIPFTPAHAGKLKLDGTTDFSVCNETSCKLIRDERLSWEVDVQ